MSMTHKASMDDYKRINYISLHAVEQLRQHIGEKHKLFSRDNNALSNAIDEAVCIGLKKDNVEKFDYEGKPNLGVDLSDFFKLPLKGIVAKNEKKDSPHRAAVVTIMAINMNMKKDKVGASLADAVSPDVQAALRAAIEHKDAPEPALLLPTFDPESKRQTQSKVVRSVVEQKPSKISTRDISADRRLITYLKEGTTEVVTEEFAAPGDLRNRIFDLHRKDMNLETVTVWKPSRASIAIALDFEEG
jgi:hypothetical protein